MIIFEIIKFILYLKYLNQKWLHKKFEKTVPSEKESSRKVIEKGLTYICKVTIKNYKSDAFYLLYDSFCQQNFKNSFEEKNHYPTKKTGFI